MTDSWLPALSFVHLAAATQIAGFLMRDQIVLRTMILIGTGFYIAYYYLEPSVPLWDAIACSLLMGAANVYTMTRLIADRRPAIFDEEDLLIYGAIRHIPPGDFKRLMKGAEKRTVTSSTCLTEEGVVPEYLYFLLGGEVSIAKDGAVEPLHAPIFIGEIAYILNQPASATVSMQAGGRYARWKVSELRRLLGKQEKLQGALEIALNRDLAAKVAAARPPATPRALDGSEGADRLRG